MTNTTTPLSPAAQAFKAAVLRDLAKSWRREAHHIAELNNPSLTPDARAGTKAALAEWQAKSAGAGRSADG